MVEGGYEGREKDLKGDRQDKRWYWGRKTKHFLSYGL